MDQLEGALDDHFCSNVLSCASRLQSAGAMDTLGDPGAMTVYTADQFGEELLQCMQGLSAAEVLLLLTAATHVKYNFIFVFADCYVFFASTFGTTECLGML